MKKRWFFLLLLIPGITHSFFWMIVLIGFCYFNMQEKTYITPYANDDYIYTYNYVFSDSEPITGSIEDIDITEYSKNDLVEGCNDGGLIFPDDIDNSVSKLFLFKEGKKGLYRSEIYLERRCEDIDLFQDEMYRLSNIKGKHNKGLLYTSDLFALPSLVATYNVYSSYEYVLVNEDSLTIYYIYLSSFEKYSNIVFDIEFAPTRILVGSDFPYWAITNGSYSIYDDAEVNNG